MTTYRDIMDAAGVPPIGEVTSQSDDQQPLNSVALACQHCKRYTPTLALCSGCRQAVYCSVLCQAEHHVCVQQKRVIY